jgi:FkbM family methyltransferase
MKTFSRLTSHFGIIRGTILLTKLKLSLGKKIKLPKIKYPIYIRPGTTDASVFLQIFANDEYDIHFNDPKVIIDGGANIGLFTILMKNKYPTSKVICVEPDSENFELLKKNTSGYNNVYYEKSGVWDKVTKLRVFDRYDTGKWGMVVEEDLINGSIPAISIKGIMEKYGIEKIDILKLDIETSEKKVFSNGYTEWLPYVKTVVIELHDRIEEGCSKPFFEAINKSFQKYKLTVKGENIVVENLDID